MAKKEKTRTKLPPAADQAEGGNTLGDVAEQLKAVAAKLEAIFGDASAKGRERIKPVVEKIRAKWHEMKGDETAGDSPKMVPAVKKAKKRAPKKTTAAKPVKKATQTKAKSASTRKAKRPKKGVKKKA